MSIISIFLAGCGVQPKPTKPKTDVTLPTVQKIRTLADIKSIALEWTPVYSERVQGYYIYRGSHTKELKRIKKIENRYSSHYLDTNLAPNTMYSYAITTYDANGRESKPSPVTRVKTLPLLDSVPFVDAIDHLPRQVKLIWRPHPYKRVEYYIIERSEPQSQKWKVIATIRGRLNAEYIDKNLKDNHIYLYRIFVKTCDGIVSKPSKIVQASTKPRPRIVQGLSASKNLPKKIVLHWLPNPEPDIDHYNVYKSIFAIGPFLKIAKTKKTSYIDLLDKDGVTRYYKVTAVDKDGLESFKQDAPVAGTTLAKPLPPVILNHTFDGHTLFISWESPDKRGVRFIVKKIEKSGLFEKQEYLFKNIQGTTFTDSNLKPNMKYEYEVYAVDKNGLVSKPSEKIVIKTSQ